MVCTAYPTERLIRHAGAERGGVLGDVLGGLQLLLGMEKRSGVAQDELLYQAGGDEGHAHVKDPLFNH